jgi:LemA protein
MQYGLFLLVLVIVIAGSFIYLYNRLITLRLRVKEAWSDIDVQLKRRSSLIPNLVNSVKGYMTHEKDLLENVTKLRTQLDAAQNPAEMGELDSQLTGALGNLKIAVENYPTLKADTTVIKLQDELTSTEDKISYSRRFYNQAVLAFNTAIQRFPNNLLAPIFGFKVEEFFKADEKEREDIEVDLTTNKKQ